MNNMIKMMNAVNNAKEMLNDLDREGFMVCMCMLFDEYHLAHNYANAVEMANEVAKQVKAVNEELGEYGD